MLVITRKRGEKIKISLPTGEQIIIVMGGTSGTGATLMIDAPKTINIAREEIFDDLMAKKEIWPPKPQSIEEPNRKHIAIVKTQKELFELQGQGFYRILHESTYHRDIMGLNVDSIDFKFMPDEEQFTTAKLRIFSKRGKILVSGQVVYDHELILKEFSNKG